jgi:hypothetical protein
LGSAFCSAAHPHVAASKTEIEVDMTKHARFIMTFFSLCSHWVDAA